jgi:hypothetical protein
VVAALVGGLAWLVKVALIWGNEGTNLDEGAVGAMYLAGLVGLVVAAGAAGAALTRTRPTWVRALAGVLGVAAFVLVSEVLDAVLSPLAEEGSWQREEVAIVATALLAVGSATAAVLSSRRRRVRAPSPST